jgi:hypothetical protein
LSMSEMLQKLKLFNEKLETVRKGRFVPQVFRPDHGVTINFDTEKPLTVVKRGADEDAILALAITLRFFVQKRDGISLWQIADIYESLPLEVEKKSARSAVDSVDKYLDTPCGFDVNGEAMTNRRLFDVFMYGGLAHANSDKRLEYETWTKGPAAEILTFYFEGIVADMLQAIMSFRRMNERTIQMLQSNLGMPPESRGGSETEPISLK